MGVRQLVLYLVGFLFFPIAFGIWLWSVFDGIIMLASPQYRGGQDRLLRS